MSKCNLFFFLILSVFLKHTLRSQGLEQFLFTENKGQWHSDIKYSCGVPHGTLYLGNKALLYTFTHPEDLEKLKKIRHSHVNNEHFKERRHSKSTSNSHKFDNEPLVLRQHSLKVSFVGAADFTKKTGSGPMTHMTNYIKGNDPSKWGTNVKTFHEVTYQKIYDGIDWRILGDTNSVKYEFVVYPNKSVDAIQLGISGSDFLSIDKKGRFVMRTSVGDIIENAPYAYQIIGGSERKVKCRFILTDTILSFKLGRYNKSYPLIIDPELIFSTLSGSTADNWGNSACVDLNGSLYGVGTVFSTTGDFSQYDLDGFPATAGAFQDTIAVDTSSLFSNSQIRFTDIGVLKYNSDGTSVEYATYIGGRECDVPTSSIVDSLGNLYILTVTSSNNLPKAVNTFFGGPSAFTGTFHYFQSGTDIAVIKLSADGSEVLSSRYVGGRSLDGVMLEQWPLTNNYGDQFRGDINLDDNGNVYVGSVTWSSDFPVTTGVIQETLGGDIDGVVFKLNNNLDTLLWSTYLGGSLSDAVFSIFRDTKNNIFVSGGTISPDFPVKSNGLFPLIQGGNDGFVSRLSNDGSSLLASTYLGTNSFDQAYFVQLDASDNPYILGQTKGRYPVSQGAYGVINGGLFIHKLTPDLDSTFFVSTLGSNNPSTNIIPNISPTAFLVNDCENMFVSGWGGIANATYNGGETRGMYISPFAYKNEFQTDGSDFYLYVLQKDAVQPIYGTYFGGGNAFSTIGEHVDGGTSRFDKEGIVYQAVCADCGGFRENSFGGGFPVYPDDNQQDTYPKDNASRNCNNGLFKFDLANLGASFTYQQECDTLLFTFTNTSQGGVDFEWSFGDGSDTLYEAANVSVLHSYEKPGDYTVTLIATDLTTCIAKDTFKTSVKVYENLIPKSEDYIQCPGISVTISSGYNEPSYKYQWSPSSAVSSPNDSVTSVLVTENKPFYVTVTNPIGCSFTDTIQVDLLEFDLNVNSQVIGNCEEKVPLVLFSHNANSAATKWYYNGTLVGDSLLLEFTFDKFGRHEILGQIDSLGCIYSNTASVNLSSVVPPNVFTPNNDDSNDLYIVKGIENSGEWKLEVYNRWSKLIYLNKAYDNTWDGGKLEDGTYYYLLTAPDESFCRGWVQILR